ncbi:MAG: FprA family A-type flavoprotein, partial [Anaerovoracaceae bacterium]
SMYGNTESVANIIATKLVKKGITNVVMYDVSNTDVSQLIAETFRLSHIVLASVTYNLGIYPKMHNYLMDMKALNLQKRTVAIVENGSWAPKSGSLMRDFLDEELKQVTVLNEELSVLSAMNEEKGREMDDLVDAIIESMRED